MPGDNQAQKVLVPVSLGHVKGTPWPSGQVEMLDGALTWAFVSWPDMSTL
jgi:hypothetical protein